jgi:hypothetical protein
LSANAPRPWGDYALGVTLTILFGVCFAAAAFRPVLATGMLLGSATLICLPYFFVQALKASLVPMVLMLLFALLSTTFPPLLILSGPLFAIFAVMRIVNIVSNLPLIVAGVLFYLLLYLTPAELRSAEPFVWLAQRSPLLQWLALFLVGAFSFRLFQLTCQRFRYRTCGQAAATTLGVVAFVIVLVAFGQYMKHHSFPIDAGGQTAA